MFELQGHQVSAGYIKYFYYQKTIKDYDFLGVSLQSDQFNSYYGPVKFSIKNDVQGSKVP